MKHPLTVEPLTNITVDGKNIAVVSLPNEIQNEISTLELYNREYITALLEVEKAELLVQIKRRQIEQMVKDIMKPVSQEAPDTEAE